MNNQKGFVSILILIVVALAAIGGGGYYFYHQQKTTPSTQTPQEQTNSSNSGTITTTKTVETHKTEDSGGIKTDINIKADITQIVDCGSEDCFQQKFAACQPSTLKVGSSFAAVDYKIVGPDTDGCKMTFRFTTNPNADWVNKEMTCTFDNKIAFQKSIENTFNGVINGSVVCSGPLYIILRSM